MLTPPQTFEHSDPRLARFHYLLKSTNQSFLSKAPIFIEKRLNIQSFFNAEGAGLEPAVPEGVSFRG